MFVRYISIHTSEDQTPINKSVRLKIYLNPVKGKKHNEEQSCSNNQNENNMLLIHLKKRHENKSGQWEF